LKKRFTKGDYEKYLLEQRKNLPGPGQYDNTKIFKGESPKYTLFDEFLFYKELF